MEFFVQDLSGRGFTCNVSGNDVLDFKDDIQDILEDETLEEWVLSSIVGDRLEANSLRITRTK